MEAVCKELDEVKAALEKLTADHRVKTELSESLRKAHNDQLVKIKEAKLEIKKQVEELNAKEEEICVLREKYEDLKSTLHEKESALSYLSSANDKLRSDYGEKLQNLEVENKELALSLDEANIRAKDQEKKICTFKEEIEGLKGLLSVSQKKFFEAEQRAEAPKELRQRDDFLMKLEEENMKIKEQFKWKKEQFTHLEEAHKKVQGEFKASKKAWEKEKSVLVDEICSLQTRLDSQTRTLESLRHQLQNCNQALVHEESRRRLLEVQISESQTSYETVCVEYQEGKPKNESLTLRRDEEIASLRNLLGTKEKFFQEMEFKNGHLAEENQELRQSLKEFQEAQIQEAGAATSLKKMRNKLRCLEQVHKDCSTNLKAREAEWNCQVEKMAEDLNDCRSKLDCKDKQLQDLQVELERCHSSIMQLKVENEEMSVILMMFKSGVSDSQSKLLNSDIEMELCNTEVEEQIALLMEQLEQKNNDLAKAHAEIEQERETAASLKKKIESSDLIEQIALLMEQLEQKNNDLAKAHAEIEQERETAASLKKKIESSDLIEQQYFLMQEELERYKEMLEDSSGQQLRLKEQALQAENSLKDELRKVSDALDKANSELIEKTHEGNEIEFELYIWKSVVERLQSCLNENQELRREMEASLLAQVEIEESLIRDAEEKEKRVGDLHHTIFSLEQEIAGKHTEISKLHEAWEKITTAVILGELEIQEKNLVIVELGEDHHCCNTEINSKLHEAWEKITTAVILGELEIQEKNLVIVELEDEMNKLHQKLELQEKSSSRSKTRAEELEATLEGKQLEMVEVMDRLQNKLRTSEGLVDKLESEKQLLLEDIMKWSSGELGIQEKITTAIVLGELGIQEKNLVIVELEDEINELRQTLELQEKSLSFSKKWAQEFEATLEGKQLEMVAVMDQLQRKLRTSEGLVEKLESDKRLLLEDITKLSTERGDLVADIGEFNCQLTKFSNEDTELMGRLGRIVQSFSKEDEYEGGDDEPYDSNRENVKTPLSSSAKKVEANPDGRPPLKVRNN